MKHWRSLIPLVLFAGLAYFLMQGLGLKPSELPSPLIGQTAPAFNLPILGQPGKTLASSELKGKVWLLNVWGSWCPSCGAQLARPR
jgi:cytochrome c biogenesis protein CcmG, thiol:disulfide interchange protein DsbE